MFVSGFCVQGRQWVCYLPPNLLHFFFDFNRETWSLKINLKTRNSSLSLNFFWANTGHILHFHFSLYKSKITSQNKPEPVWLWKTNTICVLIFLAPFFLMSACVFNLETSDNIRKLNKTDCPWQAQTGNWIWSFLANDYRDDARQVQLHIHRNTHINIAFLCSFLNR